MLIMKYIKGDLLKSNENVIVHQINCLCIRPHGLSADMFKKFPYADVYSTRQQLENRNLAVPKDRGTPGEIVVTTQPNSPTIIGLYGQYDYGRPNKSCYNSTIEQDNLELREKWFQTCLDKLKKYLVDNKHKRVAFPYKIGCGLAGGDWDNYSKMLDAFENGSPFEVVIYML
jgi:O-acetyl-ADP-ribose deacetylase (regulator of RNase III)